MLEVKALLHEIQLMACVHRICTTSPPSARKKMSHACIFYMSNDLVLAGVVCLYSLAWALTWNSDLWHAKDLDSIALHLEHPSYNSESWACTQRDYICYTGLQVFPNNLLGPVMWGFLMSSFTSASGNLLMYKDWWIWALHSIWIRA